MSGRTGGRLLLAIRLSCRLHGSRSELADAHTFWMAQGDDVSLRPTGFPGQGRLPLLDPQRRDAVDILERGGPGQRGQGVIVELEPGQLRVLVVGGGQLAPGRGAPGDVLVGLGIDQVDEALFAARSVPGVESKSVRMVPCPALLGRRFDILRQPDGRTGIALGTSLQTTYTISKRNRAFARKWGVAIRGRHIDSL